ncbi:MAG: ATP-binding cassette domain-containing protein [Candidatus Peribacteraceae bacterium]
MIEFSHVTLAYDGRDVLRDVSFQIEPGSFVCLTGPSGAGKSTIFNLLVRVIVPTSGEVLIDGADVSTFPDTVLQLYRRRIGVLYQDYKLLPHLTAEENVALPLEVAGMPLSDAEILVRDALSRFGVEDRAEAFPHELSGGEKTRVALARAVVHRPSILLVDEPTGNIDPEQSMQILRFIREIHAEGSTVIVATHDKLVVDALGVRVLRLEKGALVRDSVGGYAEAPMAVEKVVEPMQENVSEPMHREAEEHAKQRVSHAHHTSHKKISSKVRPIAI